MNKKLLLLPLLLLSSCGISENSGEITQRYTKIERYYNVYHKFLDDLSCYIEYRDYSSGKLELKTWNVYLTHYYTTKDYSTFYIGYRSNNICDYILFADVG